MNTLTRLQNWYKSNCDGDWEHEYGVKIGTLDNPGWFIEIDLAETNFSERGFFKKFQSDIDPNDWYQIKTENSQILIVCGPQNLEQVLNIFLDEIVQ